VSVAELSSPSPGDEKRTAGPVDKPGWRALLRSARRSVPAPLRAREARALAAGAVAAAKGTVDPVCCYVPVGTEPGASSMLDALREAGHEVLLPVVPIEHPLIGTRPQPLDWAAYRGPSSLVEGPFGLRQPAAPRWGAAAIATAGLVLVPALAVDHRGVRLGRGGGWYDRTLALAGHATALLAVVRDEELVPALPCEPHDVLMTGVLTPSAGSRALPLRLD
jgi:5-formyltetrahydrofolate cyclo-ligase